MRTRYDAWSIIEAQRGQHPLWVFPYRDKPVSTMNDTAWQRARREAGLSRVRIHDLHHTFACRLRAVGVSMEDRQALLGHANRSMPGHNASAVKQANLVLNRGTPNGGWSQINRELVLTGPMMAGFPASYFCIKAFSETDLTEDLKKFDVPTLILHGDDDQIVPIGASAMLSSKLVKGATLKVYKGAPHGMCTTLKDQVNEELLNFIEVGSSAGKSTSR